MGEIVYKKSDWGKIYPYEIRIGCVFVLNKTGHAAPEKWGNIWCIERCGQSIPDRVSLQLMLENVIPRLVGDKYKDQIDKTIKKIKDWEKK